MLEEFYRDNRQRFVNIIRRALEGDHAGAEDVVQTAFTRALTYASTYQPEKGDLGQWFSRILYNALSDWRRDRDGMTKDNPPPVLDEAYEEIFENFDLVVHLLNSTVSCEHKRVLQLHFIFGYNAREVREVTGISTNNIYQICHRFKRELGNEWKKT